jgi:TolB-like protein
MQDSTASTHVFQPSAVLSAESDQTDPRQTPVKKRKKTKLRSAWISFVGRIVAHLVGAVATVMVGLQLMQSYLPPSQPLGAASTVAAPASTTPRVRTDGVTVLAILALQNFSGDPTQDVFAEGLTEALTAGLAQVPALQVTSRTSSVYVRGQGGLLPAMAQQLGADLVLEGSIVRAAARVRVTAQLIDARKDTHVWTRVYERTNPDVLELYSGLSAAIVKDVRNAIVHVAPTRARASVAEPGK